MDKTTFRGHIMKKHIVAFLCLTAFNYSNANIAKWKQVVLQTVRHATQSWKHHRAEQARREILEQALQKILACPSRKEILLKELEEIRVTNNKARKALEAAYPHLKNRSQ